MKLEDVDSAGRPLSPKITEFIQQLERDRTRLEARVAELERAVEHSRFLEEVIENVPGNIFVKDMAGRYCIVNQQTAQTARHSVEALLGKADDSFLPPEQLEAVRKQDMSVLAAGKAIHFEEILKTPTGNRHFLTIKFPVRDAKGEICGVGGFAMDVTQNKLVEQEQARLQAQLLAAKEATLRELSTPLIPVTDDVLVMPIIGSIDESRASQILETLLDGISRRAARTAILDITGVRTVNAQAAEALLSAARAARLLGANIMLTGIRPDVSRSFIALGADLTGIVTLSTLQSGIEAALSASRRSTRASVP